MIDIVLQRLFPLITAGIHQFQTAAGVLNADTTAAAVFVTLGIVGIVADEGESSVVLFERDVDGGRTTRTHAVLEGILNQGDKQQGCHFRLAVGYRQLVIDGCLLVTAQFHQFDIIAHKLHLTANGHGLLVGLIHSIAQEVAQLCNGILCTVGINLRETADIVEGIEEEMGINLILQPGEFGFGILMPLLLQLLTDPTCGEPMTDGNGGSDDDYIEQEIDKPARIHAEPCMTRHPESEPLRMDPCVE